MKAEKIDLLNVSRAAVKNLRVSPRKLGLVAALIKNLHVSDALMQLTFS
jgi:ribosomal protein L22